MEIFDPRNSGEDLRDSVLRPRVLRTSAKENTQTGGADPWHCMPGIAGPGRVGDGAGLGARHLFDNTLIMHGTDTLYLAQRLHHSAARWDGERPWDACTACGWWAKDVER